MTTHNGTIEILCIENRGDNKDRMECLVAKFVHYPDSQQLQVWIPRSDHLDKNYGNYCIQNITTGTQMESGKLADRISGGRQMLIDTLSFPEGLYLLEIEHAESGTHCIDFVKRPLQLISEEEKKKAEERDDSWRLMGW